MSEFVCIQVGQCGNQIGSAFWPLLLKEYECRKALSSGSLSSFFYPSSKSSEQLNDLKNGNLKARALLIDMEDSVVSTFKRGFYKDLFENQCFLTSYPGSGNNWAVGHYEHGSEQHFTMEEMLRLSAERSDKLHAFLSMFSLSGGTGSGLGSYITTILDDYYPKIERIVACVHPGQYHDVITSPYNISFSLSHLIQTASCVFPVDNKALSDICQHYSTSKDTENWKPYRNMNSIICKMMLHLTSGSRFTGTHNLDISDLSVNLVPFPTLNLLASSFSPIVIGKNTNKILPKRPVDLIGETFSKWNQLLRINPMKCTVLSASLLGRGPLSMSNMMEFGERMCKTWKNKLSWTSLRLGLCSVPSLDNPTSLLCVSNSVSMKILISETLINFDRLFKRKAHVHHYEQVLGFPEDKFEATREALLNLIQNYENATQEMNIPRLQV